jgi:hypothetical protein
MIETLILRFQFHYVTEIVTPLPALNPYPCALNNWFLSLTGFFSGVWFIQAELALHLCWAIGESMKLQE